MAAALTRKLQRFPGGGIDLAWLALGGVLVGLAGGWLGLLVIRKLRDSELIITATLLLAAVSYMACRSAGVSGVLATVTTGLLLGWHQHEAFAGINTCAKPGFLENTRVLDGVTLFILIGLSLRGALERSADCPNTSFPSVGVVADRRIRPLCLSGRFQLVRRRRDEERQVAESEPIFGGYYRHGLGGYPQGVVTLAAALSLPVGFWSRYCVGRLCGPLYSRCWCRV